jgi:tetratricopeptide (TPR) repeat protein
MIMLSRSFGRLVVAAVLALAWLAIVPQRACARAESGWVGKRVVPRSPGFTLEIDDERASGAAILIAIYRVERQDDGPSLWLVAEVGRGGGRARPEDVIPLAQAVDFFTEAIRAHPREAFYFAMRGVARHDRNESDLAIRDYDESLRLDPSNATVYSRRASAWNAKGQYDRAIADLTASLALDPKSVVAYIGRGAAWAAKQDPDRAIEDYSEAIWLDPLAITAYSGRGAAWHAKKEFEKAIVDYNMVIRLDPQNVRALSARALAWNGLKRHIRALADCDEAIRIDPEEPAAYNNRAWIWATASDPQFRDQAQAIESATRACRLTGWKHAGYLATLAAAYAKAGDFDRAVTWQTRANAAGFDREEKTEGQKRLERYRARKPYHESGS